MLGGLLQPLQKHNTLEMWRTDKEKVLSEITFTEMVIYVEEACLDNSTTSVFKLADLIYTSQGLNSLALRLMLA